jgi:hypothetical protein
METKNASGGPAEWVCKTCGIQLVAPVSACPSGQHSTNIPSNVVLAAQDEPYLMSRFERAKEPCDESQRLVLEYCEHLVGSHFSVSINMHPHTLLALFQDDRVRYVNLHDSRKAGSVIDYPPDAAAKRLGIDTLVFGIDGDKLNYGAVNLGGVGTFSYGAACVFLREEQILQSVSFLENNSFAYVSQSGSAVKLDVPHGVRALWGRAPILVLIKHLTTLLRSTAWTITEMAQLILFSEGDKKTDNYVEAQISFPITQKCIKRIVDPALDRKADPHTIEGRAALVSRNALTSFLESGIPGIEVEVLNSPNTH